MANYVTHDVESTEHGDRGGDLLGNHLELGLSHVAADKFDTGFDVIGQTLEEASQVGVAAAPLDLVHADRLDHEEITMDDAPQNGAFYSSKHVVPCRVEGDSCLLPRQAIRPSSEEPAVSRRQMLLALSPLHALDGRTALRAIDTPQGLDEEHRDVPQRHELEPPRREPVVAGPLLAAPRADRPATGPRLDLDLDAGLCTTSLNKRRLRVDKRLVRLDAIENSLELHPAVAPGEGLINQPHLYRKTPQDTSFSPWVRPKGASSMRRTAAACRVWRLGREPAKWQVAWRDAVLWWMPIHPNWKAGDGSNQPREALLPRATGPLSSPFFARGFCRGIESSENYELGLLAV